LESYPEASPSKASSGDPQISWKTEGTKEIFTPADKKE
jgi:hypothetical protein